MTDHEINTLADRIAARQKHSTCPMGLTADSVAFLNDAAALWRRGKTIAFGVIVTALCLMFLAGLVKGLIQLAREGKLPVN